MPPSIGLPAVNFFMADVGGGLGPFLSTWLVQTQHWGPDRIGYVLFAGMLAGMVLSTPAGALIDRVGHPRAMLAATCLFVVGGTLALFVVHGFWPVLMAQVLVATGGALAGPALTALTLSIVGKNVFPRQQGVNQAATHAGNVAAAAAIWWLSFTFGAWASIGVLAAMAVGMLVTIGFFPRDCIDHSRMHGRKPFERGERRGTMRALLRNRRLIVLTLAIGLFNFGNGAVLPLLGQRLAVDGSHDPTQWLAVLVIVAQAVMIPVSWLAGRSADHFGRRFLLIGACAVLAARGMLATISADPGWLVVLEILDGIGAGMLSVAGPAAIADLTYGGGRTQTAMGGVQTVQSLASALSAGAGGLLVLHLGWAAAFGALAVFPLLSVALLMTIHLKDEKPAPSHAGQGENAAASSARV
jgi:MFS family permease